MLKGCKITQSSQARCRTFTALSSRLERSKAASLGSVGLGEEDGQVITSIFPHLASTLCAVQPIIVVEPFMHARFRYKRGDVRELA